MRRIRSNSLSRRREGEAAGLTFPVADFSEIKMEILKHGDMVEVIKPKSLTELIKTEAENIAKIY